MEWQPNNDVMELHLPVPTLVDLSACKVATVIWQNRLTISRDRWHVDRDYENLDRPLPPALSKKNRKLIQKQNDIPLILKEKLLLWEAKIAINVYNFSYDRYPGMDPFCKMFVHLNFLGEVDSASVFRFSQTVWKYHHHLIGMLETVCAIGDRDLIYDCLDILDRDEQQRERVLAALDSCLANISEIFYGIMCNLVCRLPGLYFACERLGKLEELARVLEPIRIRLEVGLSSLLEYMLHLAVTEGVMDVNKILVFLNLLPEEQQQSQSLRLVSYLLPPESTCKRVTTWRAGLIHKFLQKLNIDTRIAFIKQNMVAILFCFYNQHKFRCLVLPLARELFNIMTIDQYQKLVDKLISIVPEDGKFFNREKFFVEFFHQSPIHLQDSIFGEFYLSLKTSFDVDIAILKSRSKDDLFMLGGAKCRAWISAEDWTKLHVFLKIVIPVEHHEDFQEHVRGLYYRFIGLDSDNLDYRWLMFQRVCMNVLGGLDSSCSAYCLGRDSSHSFQVRCPAADDYKLDCD